MQSSIGLTGMVPEIIMGGGGGGGGRVRKDPGPFSGEKPSMNRVKYNL